MRFKADMHTYLRCRSPVTVEMPTGLEVHSEVGSVDGDRPTALPSPDERVDFRTHGLWAWAGSFCRDLSICVHFGQTLESWADPKSRSTLGLLPLMGIHVFLRALIFGNSHVAPEGSCNASAVQAELWRYC